MKLINKDNISHTIALDVQKGAWSGIMKMDTQGYQMLIFPRKK